MTCHCQVTCECCCMMFWMNLVSCCSYALLLTLSRYLWPTVTCAGRGSCLLRKGRGCCFEHVEPPGLASIGKDVCLRRSWFCRKIASVECLKIRASFSSRATTSCAVCHHLSIMVLQLCCVSHFLSRCLHGKRVKGRASPLLK